MNTLFSHIKKKYLKKVVFYLHRIKHYKKYAFLATLNAALPITHTSLTEDPNIVAATLEEGVVLHSFFPKTHENTINFYKHIHWFLKKPDQRRIPFSHMVLANNILTRYYYPHMKANAYPPFKQKLRKSMFHLQHADCIDDFQLAEPIKQELRTTFSISPGDIILDIGCHIGLGALAVSKDIGPDGHIYAIEADPLAYNILCKNIEANNIQNITPIHAAISDTTGTGMFAQGGFQRNSLVHDIVKDKLSSIEVPIRSIDDIVTQYSIPRVTLISLTINGAEPNAITGATNVLTTQSPAPNILFAGWYTLDNGQTVYDTVSDMLIQHGYHCYKGIIGKGLAYKKDASLIN